MKYFTLFFSAACLAAAGCAKPPEPPANAVTTAVNRPAPAATPVTEPSHPEDNAERITLADAKKAFDEGKAYFVDARAEAVYQAEHIKGAVNITPETLDSRLKDLPKDKTIIVYCS
jgi:hypothetical protein